MASWDNDPVAKGPWDNDPVAEKPADTVSRGRAAMGGVNAGVAGILGLPVDTAQNVVNLGKAAYGTAMTAIGKPDLAPQLTTNTPGGSEWISGVMNQLGINTSNPNPNDVPSQMLYRGGTILPAAAIPGASLKQTLMSAAGAAAGEQVGGTSGAMIGAMAPAAASQAYAATRGKTLAQQQIEHAQTNETLKAARKEGYKFPPAESNPGSLTNKIIEGIAGKTTTRQMISAKNQAVTNRIAKKSIGIGPDEQLNDSRLNEIRTDAGAVYEKVKDFGAQNNLRIKTDGSFKQQISDLGGDINSAIKEFPDLVKVPQIETLQKALNVKDMTPTAAVELIKTLRQQSKDNFRSSADNQSLALARAQRRAANAIEGLVERALSRSGQTEIYRDFKNARTMIARTYDIESALNPATGNVNARVLENLHKKGKPLGQDLELIAKTHEAFPKAMQTPETIGSQPVISPLDFGIGGIMAALSNPKMIGLISARPVMRSMLSSNPYQVIMGTPSYGPLLTPDSGLAALLRGNLAGNMTQ